jgi:PAS domain S-box-containing protein
MRHAVLCVDDELDTLVAYRRFLETDYAIHLAESGEQALALMAERGPFAVVVSDLQMQGMDGIHLLSIVREKYPESVRILLTGRSDLEHAIQAVNDGHLFRFLTKPCRPVTLSDAVKAAVTQHELVINNRKQVREGPRASEDLSRAVLDSVLALIAVLDRTGTVVAVNTAWNKFGVENEVNTFGGPGYLKAGVNYIEACRNGQGAVSEQASTVAAGIRAVLDAEQRSFELEYPCRTRDGQRYFMLSVTPLSAAGGGAVVSHTDITERVLTEHALRASEDRYRQVLQDQTEVVCRTRHDGTITFVSEVFCRVVGRTAEQLLGYKWHQVPGLKDVAGIQASLNQMTPADPVVRIENRISDAEGSAFTIRPPASSRFRRSAAT